MGIRHPLCDPNISNLVPFMTITRHAQCDWKLLAPFWVARLSLSHLVN